MLDFAGLTWRYAGSKEAAIRREFGMSATRYHQVMLGLMERPEALAYAPVTVGRLQRLRLQRAGRRSARQMPA